MRGLLAITCVMAGAFRRVDGGRALAVDAGPSTSASKGAGFGRDSRFTATVAGTPCATQCVDPAAERCSACCRNAAHEVRRLSAACGAIDFGV